MDTKMRREFSAVEKKTLTSAPILKIVDPDEDFVVCMYVCKEGFNGVLNKNYIVVCYVFQKLKEHEGNHDTHNLELEKIVHALKIWRHYLTRRIFELMTYHYGLKHLFGQPTLNSRKTRCLEFHSEYELEIKHIKGK
jgi:hypothetical protein